MALLKSKVLLKYGLLLFIFFVFFLLSKKNMTNKTILTNVTTSHPVNQTVNVRNHVKIFDLNQALEPKSIYDSINCRESALIFVKTTLCVHDLNKDSFVSKDIWKLGVWERNTIGK